jgi:hemoglobin
MFKTLTGSALLALACTAAWAGPTLFERIGGEAKLRAVVDDFMTVMESDDRINFTFAETDIPKFKQLLYEQICELTRGPCRYTGRDMRTSHEKLNIDDAMFNALAEDLYIAFERQKVPYRLQNKVVVLLAPMQREIVKPRSQRAASRPPR